MLVQYNKDVGILETGLNSHGLLGLQIIIYSRIIDAIVEQAVQVPAEKDWRLDPKPIPVQPKEKSAVCNFVIYWIFPKKNMAVNIAKMVLATSF